MDTTERDRIIYDALRILRLRSNSDVRGKLQKLLNERQIPFLLPKNDLEVRKSIASGEYGIVELVRYQKKLYAHKKARTDRLDVRNSILDEAIKLTEISEEHPNIQRLYFVNLKSLGFLMDYCDGGALDVFIKNDALTYTLVDALKWAYQLADALSFLHSKNIMHRDVKLQNILLKDNYQKIVLTDYGTATNLGRSLLTNDVGTPVTMAPEVVRGTDYGEQCDIFSWSIVFWQLLSKQYSPYENQNISKFALVMKVLNEKLRPPKLNHCPKIFLALLYRSCHSDPHERPSLLFIKTLLRLLLNVLPKNEQECSAEMLNEIRRQCTNGSNTLEKYLPCEPRWNNEQSKNIFEEHLKKLKHISNTQEDISKLEHIVQDVCNQNESKRNQHKQLLEENERLKKQIQELRASKAQ